MFSIMILKQLLEDLESLNLKNFSASGARLVTVLDPYLADIDMDDSNREVGVAKLGLFLERKCAWDTIQRALTGPSNDQTAGDLNDAVKASQWLHLVREIVDAVSISKSVIEENWHEVRQYLNCMMYEA